jgi:hypothetical protein
VGNTPVARLFVTGNPDNTTGGTGTVSATIGGTTITGSGTNFNIVIGNSYTIKIGSNVYAVRSVDSATQVTIFGTIAATVSGSAWTFRKPTFLGQDYNQVSLFGINSLGQNHLKDATAPAVIFERKSARSWLARVVSSNNNRWELRNDTANTTPFYIDGSAPDLSLYIDSVGHQVLASVAGSTTESSFWSDSTQKALQTYVAGIEQTLSGTIFTQTNTVTVANTVTETALTGTGVGTLTLPANFFTIGKSLNLVVRGFMSDTGTPTLRIRVKLGSTTIGDTGAVALVGTINNEVFEVSYSLTCRTTGATGTVIGQGHFEFDNSTNSGLFEGMPSTGTTTIDTTATQAISVTAEWGTADPADTISATNCTIEVLN